MKNPLQKNPLISVILAVHNGMPYLPFCINSVLRQSYKNMELIIVDDGSDDTTDGYLSSLNDKRVHLIRNRKNVGLARSLNLALKKAKGHFVARMDSDDVSALDRIFVQHEFLSNNPDVDICGTWALLINNSGKKVGLKKMPKSDLDIKKSLDWYCPIIHPSLMAKREIFSKLKGYDPAYDYAEDYEFLTRAKQIATFANIPKALIQVRLQDQRRSFKHMRKVNHVDLKIKIKSVRMYGLNLSRSLALLKQFTTYYLFPTAIKVSISKFLKIA